MNTSGYPFSKFIGIDISKDKIDIAEFKGAAGKTIGNNKTEGLQQTMCAPQYGGNESVKASCARIET